MIIEGRILRQNYLMNKKISILKLKIMKKIWKHKLRKHFTNIFMRINIGIW